MKLLKLSDLAHFWGNVRKHIPTKTSDLTNDSNFVDTSNSAVASGITSAKVTSYDSHIADTDIHVTTADKNKWNNNTYVLRYSSSSVTDNSTIAYSTLDNTDNIKTGDKVIDVDGKIFTVVSVDTANQTVTVGTALIDLALDSNVVHTSGNETVGGIKTFSNNTYITSLNFTNEVESQSSSSSAVFPIVTTVTYTDQSPSQTARLNFRITANGDKSLYPHENNQYSLGVTSRRWTTIYGYFASLGGTYLGNELSANERTNLYLLANRDTDGQSGAYIGRFRQNRAQGAMSDGDVSFISFDFLENSTRYTRCFTMGLTDWDSDGVPQTYYLTSPSGKGLLGTSVQKWIKINGLNPSSLGMPDLSNGVDISSYLNTGASTNDSYTAPVNGYIGIIFSSSTACGCYVYNYTDGVFQRSNSITDSTYSNVCGVFVPVLKNQTLNIASRATENIVSAKFFPCQGNV